MGASRSPAWGVTSVIPQLLQRAGKPQVSAEQERLPQQAEGKDPPLPFTRAHEHVCVHVHVTHPQRG